MSSINADLINSVQVALESDGVLNALRSQLRAHVLQALKKTVGHENKVIEAKVDIHNSTFSLPSMYMFVRIFLTQNALHLSGQTLLNSVRDLLEVLNLKDY